MVSETHDSFVERLSNAPTMDSFPPIADPLARAPLNPPQRIQQKFVGASYAAAYVEAETFVDEAFEQWPSGDIAQQVVLDFGSGWGRITRMLLRRLNAPQVWSSDVDAQMSVLLQSTLPGVNAITNTPMPPLVFRDGMFDAVTAFSVFSHLSEEAHRRWAAEFARITRPGGKAFITLLEERFLRIVAAAQDAVAASEADTFTSSLASVVPDGKVALEQFRDGAFIFGGGGDDGPRQQDFYGWAAAPRAWIDRVWGEAGFTVEKWVHTGELFDQAMVVLVRREPASLLVRVRRRLVRLVRG